MIVLNKMWFVPLSTFFTFTKETFSGKLLLCVSCNLWLISLTLNFEKNEIQERCFSKNISKMLQRSTFYPLKLSLGLSWTALTYDIFFQLEFSVTSGKTLMTQNIGLHAQNHKDTYIWYLKTIASPKKEEALGIF